MICNPLKLPRFLIPAALICNPCKNLAFYHNISISKTLSVYYITELRYEFDGNDLKIFMRMRSKKLQISVIIHYKMFI